MTTIELLNVLNHNKNISIDKLLERIPEINFVDYVEALLEEKKMNKAFLIKKSTLDRNYAYQILNGSKNPSQDKVIMLALALQLDLHDTNNLLTLTQNKILYPKIKRDALIILCLNKQFDVIKTNELLSEYDFDILE